MGVMLSLTRIREKQSKRLAHGDLDQMFRCNGQVIIAEYFQAVGDTDSDDNSAIPEDPERFFLSPLITLGQELIGCATGEGNCREAIGAPNRDARDLKQRNAA